MFWYVFHWVCFGASLWFALAGNPVSWLSAGIFFLLLWTYDI